MSHDTPGAQAASQPPARVPGPRALRLTVRRATRMDGEDAISLEPGTPSPALRSGGPPPPPLIDGIPVSAWLDHRDDSRSVLVEGDGEAIHRTRVLFGPLRAASSDGIIRRELVVDGWKVELEAEPERRASLRDRARRATGASRHGGPTDVRAIIPGRVVTLDVEIGSRVEAGERLLVIEAMKMQNEIRAPRGGTIESVPVRVGGTVELDEVLVVIGQRPAAGESA